MVNRLALGGAEAPGSSSLASCAFSPYRQSLTKRRNWDDLHQMGVRATGCHRSGASIWLDRRGSPACTAEKGQFVLGGTSAHGVLINKTGEGFLHNAPTDCAAGFKSVRGVAEVTGYCGSVDKDGDRIFMKWVCSNNAEGWCVGEFDWIDGTGKYQGISGKNTLRYKTFGSRTGADTTHGTPFENEGYGIWEGSWRLP